MVTMHNWFECKVTYDKISLDDGKQKKVSDVYLIDAMSFSEAEARVIEVVRPYMTGEFTVANIKRKKIHEIVDAIDGINQVDAEAAKLLKTNQNQSEDADIWFDCKVEFIVLDVEKGKESKIPANMLVNANSPRTANDTLVEHMKGTMSDWRLVKISETPILDVVPYEPKISNPPFEESTTE